MQKSKSAPQPLMKRIVYPFILGAVVYVISSSIFFVFGYLLAAKWNQPFFFFVFGYPISFLVLGPLLTLGFAYQRSGMKRKGKRKIKALAGKIEVM